MKMWQKHVAVMTAVVMLLSPMAALAEAIQVDEGLAPYQKVDGISGTLNSIGSDTMNNLLKYWSEAFRKYYPGVAVQVEGKGSSTAPPALISGTAQLGPMSRAMKSTEIDQIEAKYGFKPTEIRTSLDALAVFVHKDNPLTGLSLDKVDAVFSKNRKRGYPEDIITWGQLGLTGDWASKPISLYGRNSASGTYGFFKEHTLDKGDYKDEVKEQPGSASVVQGVTEDRFAIGYSGIGYITSGVKAISLAEQHQAQYANPPGFKGETNPSNAEFQPGEGMYAPTYENVLSRKYPLARYLYVYIVNDPNTPLDPLVREFMKFVLSKEGQEIVIKDGYLPIPAKVAQEEFAKLD